MGKREYTLRSCHCYSILDFIRNTRVNVSPLVVLVTKIMCGVFSLFFLVFNDSYTKIGIKILTSKLSTSHKFELLNWYGFMLLAQVFFWIMIMFFGQVS
jgi:hypothetical protein